MGCRAESPALCAGQFKPWLMVGARSRWGSIHRIDRPPRHEQPGARHLARRIIDATGTSHCIKIDACRRSIGHIGPGKHWRRTKPRDSPRARAVAAAIQPKLAEHRRPRNRRRTRFRLSLQSMAAWHDQWSGVTTDYQARQRDLTPLRQRLAQEYHDRVKKNLGQ